MDKPEVVKLAFTVVIPPQGQMRARSAAWVDRKTGFARSATHKSEKQEVAEEKLLTLLYDHRPPQPLTGALALGVKAFFQPPPSMSAKKTTEALAGGIHYTKKPDLDNLLKHLKDVLKGVFYLDDKQVVKYLDDTGKYYGSPARWEITLIALEPQEETKRHEEECGNQD